jgi:hypothetical protein
LKGAKAPFKKRLPFFKQKMKGLLSAPFGEGDKGDEAQQRKALFLYFNPLIVWGRLLGF